MKTVSTIGSAKERVESTLFSALIEEVSRDLSIYQKRNPLPNGSRPEDFFSPEMATDLLMRTSRGDIALPPDFNIGRQYAISSLVPGLRKKYVGDPSSTATSESRLHDDCVADFVSSNDRCRIWNLEVSPHLPMNAGFYSVVLGECASLLSSVFDEPRYSFSFDRIARGIASGPGASASTGKSLETDPGSFSRMAEGPMTFSSSDVASIYKCLILMTPLTYATEAARKKLYGDKDKFDCQAKFLSVRKTAHKRRGICTQPSGNMVLQLATHAWFSEVLRERFCIDLATQQEKNRWLARVGSMGPYHASSRSWEFCTVDMTTASDLIPLLLICLMYPAKVYEWICAIRSPTVVTETSNRTFSVLTKEMVATMGNGFCFSLMTLTFTAIVTVLYQMADIPLTDCDADGNVFKTFGAYGDDLIVDKRVFEPLTRVLSAFGGSVNIKKSFSSGTSYGGFRESCGGDYFNGYPVRPVFCELLRTQADIFSLLNRLTLWGVQHSVDLPHTIRYLRKTAAKFGDELRVPNWEDVSSGFHVPVSLAFPSIKKLSEHSDSHHSLMQNDPKNFRGRFYKLLVPKARYRFVFKETDRRDIKYSDIATKREFVYSNIGDVAWYVKNGWGVLLFTLSGDVRIGKYGLRSRATSYLQEVKYAPFWGDPLLFGSSATRASTGTSRAAYVLWEKYLIKNTAKTGTR